MQLRAASRLVPRTAVVGRQPVLSSLYTTFPCTRGTHSGCFGPQRLHQTGAPSALSSFVRRTFSSEASSAPVPDRVIKAVERYIAMRKDELEKEDNSEDRKKMLESLSQDVTQASKWEQFGFDDLDRVEVLLEVEDEFGHIIPDDMADSIQSVEETIEYIQKQV